MQLDFGFEEFKTLCFLFAKYCKNKNSPSTVIISHHLAFILVVSIQFSVVPKNE